MDLKEFKEGIGYFKSKKGLEGITYNESDKESLILLSDNKALDNIAKDFIYRINSNPELLKDIKEIRKKVGLTSKEDRNNFNYLLNFLKTATELDDRTLENRKKEYPGLFNKLEEAAGTVKKTAGLAGELGRKYSLSGEEIGYLWQYVTSDEIKARVFIQIETRNDEADYYYLKIHKNVTPEDIRKVWPGVKEYLKGKPQQPGRKSYLLSPELHFEIYQDHLRGLTNKQIVNKYNKYSLDIDLVGKTIKRYERIIPDKIS
ncbi:MAG: hypothetical protein WCP14_04370 [bacterium]